MRIRRALAALLVLTSACGGSSPTFDPNPPGWQAALDGALSYLETTQAEFGLDVVVSLQIVGALTGEARPLAVAEARRPGLRQNDLDLYGSLLDIPKPVFARGSLGGVQPSDTTPDPEMQRPPNGASIATCLGEILQCRLDDTCLGFATADDQWGYVLTHQAVWLLFARWAGCETPVDIEARRRVLAVNLIKAMRADPAFSDLAVERLAMLGHLGFGDQIEPEWIATVLAAQEPEGCWRVGPDRPCHPHPTGLALWAMALARAAGRWPSAAP